MLLVLKVGVWRDVEVVGVGDVVKGLLRGRLCVGKCDPHDGVLGA